MKIIVNILLLITSVILWAEKVLGRSEETRQLYSILKPARKRSWRLRVSWLVIYWLLCWTTILLKNWFDYTHYRFGNLGLVVTKIKFHKNLQLGRFTPKTCREILLRDLVSQTRTWRKNTWWLETWGDEVWVSVTEFITGYLCTKSSMVLHDNLCDYFGLLEALDSTYCFREHCPLEFKKLRQHLKL